MDSVPASLKTEVKEMPPLTVLKRPVEA